MLKTTSVRLSDLDRKHVRAIIAHIRKLNSEVGIISPVTMNDAVQWALCLAAREILVMKEGAE